jgi:enamine deaminase RidA (YjgF/YER057c/UK114 family)
MQGSLRKMEAPQPAAPACAPPREAAMTRECVINVRAAPGESIGSIFSRLEIALKERDASLLLLMVFGGAGARDEGTRTMRRFLGAVDWPVLWVEGASCFGTPIAGVQAFALQGGELERVLWQGRIVGTAYEDADARHCLFGGIGPQEVAATPEVQARQTFEGIEAALDRAGFTLADVARTWFYNDDILGWYDAFNRVRTDYYRRAPFRSGSLPASTGISARNPCGAALAVAGWAVQPLNAGARVFEVGSPLQCPAPSYGSSFSRGMEIDSGGRRRLLVSGTASIAPQGETAFVGDIRRQVALTMDVIAAILQSREMDFGTVTRAIAYFKDPGDVGEFERWLAERGLAAMPFVPVHSDICRHDLLFELELDAIAAAPGRRPQADVFETR